jgi:predicted RNase H-like HicB family nuclease
MPRYAVVIERTKGGYSAHVPDLPGCIATGSTVEEVTKEIGGAIRLHIDGLQEDGQSVGEPRALVKYVEV